MPREVFRKAYEAGVLGAGYPVEYGGTWNGPWDVFHDVVKVRQSRQRLVPTQCPRLCCCVIVCFECAGDCYFRHSRCCRCVFHLLSLALVTNRAHSRLARRAWPPVGRDLPLRCWWRARFGFHGARHCAAAYFGCWQRLFEEQSGARLHHWRKSYCESWVWMLCFVTSRCLSHPRCNLIVFSSW